jgi:hypothetical protein
MIPEIKPRISTGRRKMDIELGEWKEVGSEKAKFRAQAS